MTKIIYATLLSACCSLLHAANVTPIIPAPVKAEILEGKFRLLPSCRVVADKDFAKEADLLAARLRQGTGLDITTATTPPAADEPVIQLTAQDADAKLGPEGYELTVTTNGVIIRATTGAGVFYGTQSFLQLLPPQIFSSHAATNVNWLARCVHIEDYPRFAWRGFMLDVSRHFFTKEEVEQTIDLMALYKLNTFHWHLVDDNGWRIQIYKYPRLTDQGAWRDDIGFGLDPKASTAYDANGHYGGFYTQHEIREVVAYAALRHITIVPEIEMPGHSGAALRAYTENLCPSIILNGRKYRALDNVYCAGNEAAFQFIDDILAEVTPLFPGKYLHIGGDEVDKHNWMHCALCKERMKEENLQSYKELQAYFIRRVEKLVDAHGKSLIGWSEIRDGGLASSATLMDWIGGGLESAESGHDVVMSPTEFCYFDHYQSTNQFNEPKAIGGYLPLSKVYQFDPVPSSLPAKFQSHILGGQANLWTEYIPNFKQVEYMMFPRLGALSEADWSPKKVRDWEDFKNRTALNEKRLAAMSVNFRPLFEN